MILITWIVDKLRDELIKIKTNYHQKNKDFNELKTRKLDNNYKNNLKFIEFILNDKDKTVCKKIKIK